MSNAYLIVSTVIFLYLAIIWSKSSGLNSLLKTIYIVVCFWGAALILRAFQLNLF